MAIDTKKISALLQGEKVSCAKCKDGKYLPLRNDVPANKQTYFVCDKCGDAVSFVKKLVI